MATTFKQRMLAAIRGELPDILPYAPRLDLWYISRAAGGTLPPPHAGRRIEEICRAEGWGIYGLTPDYQNLDTAPESMALAALGLYQLPVNAFRYGFTRDIQVDARREGDVVRATFHTPAGQVSAAVELNDRMRRDGITLPWVLEPLIKRYDDWKIVARIFEGLDMTPNFASLQDMEDAVGEDGLVATPVEASSPMHHIQKYLVNATEFYIYYKERRNDLAAFADSVANYFDQALDMVADSPAQVVTWGGNYDATITYPPFFAKEILPWLERVSVRVKGRGKLLLTHCDGENRGLMEMIKHSGVDAAESVCPYPMTRLTLDEYYARWADRITIIGGVPADLMIAEQTSDADFKVYLDYLLKAVAPGRRFIAGITDGTPATADFDRLRRLHDFIEAQGRLPLAGGPLPAIFRREADPQAAGPPTAAVEPVPEVFAEVRDAVFRGDDAGIGPAVGALLETGAAPEAILQQGMIAAMEIVGERFSAGETFIPEMLLAARAMAAGVAVLKPRLVSDAAEASTGGTIVIGSVAGDMHDIGKNLVAMMLRGVGFEVVDLGTNVSTADFVRTVKERGAGLVALSALLTTTMPAMEQVVQALDEAGLKEKTAVLVGGAPVSAKFADQVGADGYAPNAGEAVRAAKRLIAGRSV